MGALAITYIPVGPDAPSIADGTQRFDISGSRAIQISGDFAKHVVAQIVSTPKKNLQPSQTTIPGSALSGLPKVVNPTPPPVIPPPVTQTKTMVAPPAPARQLQQTQTNPPNQNEGGIAATYPGRDTRPYSMSDEDGTVDCSRFTREVAHRMGYNIPRTAFAQATWYQRNGTWDRDVNNAQAGDHIFWNRGPNA